MKLAVSNIAWAAGQDAVVASSLVDAGVDMLEVAPGRLFSDPSRADAAAATATRRLWSDRGLPIGSMQALLFGQSELTLFGADEGTGMVRYLTRIFDLAARLGAGPMVFGSPGNRKRGAMGFDEALRRAVPAFRDLADIASAGGTTLCLEPNAPGYGCDFMTSLEETSAVVDAVDRPGVRLVVDTGNMAMVGDHPATAARLVQIVHHLHLSRPQLQPLMSDDPFPRRVLDGLRTAGYDGIVTIEMRPAEDDPITTIRQVAALVRKWIDGP